MEYGSRRGSPRLGDCLAGRVDGFHEEDQAEPPSILLVDPSARDRQRRLRPTFWTALMFKVASLILNAVVERSCDASRPVEFNCELRRQEAITAPTMGCRRLAGLLVTAALSLSCGGDRAPTQVTAHARALISDGAHGGTKGFYFLPPLVDHPRLEGAFQGDLSPVVRIDAIDAVDSHVLGTIATYTTTTGTNGEVVRASGAHYMVEWKTREFTLSTTARYRISVSLDQRQLGFIDARIVNNGQTRVVTEADHIVVGAGATVPIKFWLNRCAPVVCAAADGCHEAGSCDPATGACSQTVRPDGTACSDGDLCTQTDTCQAGVCTGANPVVCTTPPGCTTPAACQPSTGQCSTASGCSRCGDGVLASGEQCDDGNTVGGDGCSATCTLEGCGDGQVQPGEVPVGVEFLWLASSCIEDPQPITFRINGSVALTTEVYSWSCSCSPGYSSYSLFDQQVLGLLRAGNNDLSVQFPQSLGWAAVRVYTGTSNVSEHVIFDHEGGGDAESRNSDICLAGAATDGAAHATAGEIAFGEECDDGNRASGDGCSAICGAEACGNGRFDFGEECDDGNVQSNDGCTDTCRLERCYRVSCDEDEEEGPRHPCRTGVCNPDSGQCQDVARPDGTSCNDRSVCTRTDTCQAGQCVGGNPLDCSAQNECQLDGTCHPVRGCELNARPDGTACSDGRGCTGADSCLKGSCIGVVTTACFAAQVTPIDPVVPTTLVDSTAFLYLSAEPVQTGMSASTIDAARAAVVRGRLKTRGGQPLGAVRVTVAGHPEYGETRTREDGMYDLALNGGGSVTVIFERPGYLPVERTVEVPWQDYRVLADVIMTPLDTQATPITFPSATFQSARASVVTDDDGPRQATLLFPPDTYATLQGPDVFESADLLNVRVTEYTVGLDGPAAMPAQLPANSGYTYAVELTADEASNLDADVQFSNPVYLYVENFLDFPVGWSTAVGFYKKQHNAWCAEKNGRVIGILDVEDGLAVLDVDGSGNPASPEALAALQLSDGERAQLAALYSPGQTLWRNPIPHFSTADVNPPFGFPKGFREPLPDVPEVSRAEATNCVVEGSILECENQSLGQEIPITGTALSLAYRSRTTQANRAARTVRVPLKPLDSEALTPDKVQIQVTVAGRVNEQVYHRSNFPRANPVFDVEWDGLDAYGRRVQGAQKANIDVGYTYPIIYREPAEIDEAFAQWSWVLPDATLNRAAASFTLHADPSQARGAAAEPHITLGNLAAPAQEMGGWTLSGHHRYDPNARVLYSGDGSLTTAADVSRVVNFIAGNGTSFSDRLEGKAFEISVGLISEVAAAPNGDIYFHDGRVVRKLDRNGDVSVVRFHVDGGGIQGMTVGPDGSLYYTRMHIREILRDGERIAGNFFGGTTAEGVDALDASFSLPMGVAPAPDGSVYVADTLYNRIRKITPCGKIWTVVGQVGQAGTSPDGTPAASALIDRPHKIAVGPDGTLYYGELGRIRKVGADGLLSTLVGTGVRGYSGDGGPALQAQIACDQVCRVVFGRSGSIFISDNGRIREIGADGIISTVAGDGRLTLMQDKQSTLASPVAGDISTLPDGRLIVAQAGPSFRIARLESPLPHFEGKETLLVGPDGNLLVFSREGRHMSSRDSLTGEIRERYEYDGAGRLVRRIDHENLVTTIERDADGRPQAIVAPGGQRTTLQTDTNGFLSRIANPAGEAYRFTYDAQGLMRTMLDPRDNEHRFDYDPQGRLIRDDDPAGGFTTFSRSGGPRDYTVLRTTSLGKTSRYRVEHRRDGSRRRTVTREDGLSEVEERDQTGGRIVQAPDGSRATVRRAPDPRFGVQAAYDASGSFLTAERSTAIALARTVTTRPDGFVATQSEQLTSNGRVTQRTFDGATRTWTQNSPGGRQYTLTVDSAGRVLREQLGNLQAVEYQYDPRGRLTTVSAGTGAGALVNRMTYDALDRLATMTDASGRTVEFGYDDADRMTTHTLGGGGTTTTGHDRSGNVTSVAPPGRPAHSFGFNAVGRLVSYLPPGAAAPVEIGYNADKQVTSFVMPGTSGATIELDGAGRASFVNFDDAGAVKRVGYDWSPLSGYLTSAGSLADGTVTYQHDGVLVRSLTSSGHVSGSVEYARDADANVVSETVTGSGPVTFSHDADGLMSRAGGLIVTRDPSTGLVTGTTLGTVTDQRTLDGFGNLDAYHAQAASGPVVTFDYERGLGGVLSRKVETTPSGTKLEEYSYDAAGRLWRVHRDGQLAATYLYDDNGNRLSRTTPAGQQVGTYNDQDQLVTYGDWSFTYTPGGSLRTRRHVPSGAVTTYHYDLFGNLRQVDLPDGRRLEYRLDAEGRRVAKAIDGVLVRRWLHGNDLLPAAELDGAGDLISRRVVGPDTGAVYLQTPSGEYRVITDHLGGLRFLVAADTGAVALQRQYDEFGVIVADSGTALTSIGFAGGMYDADTGLVQFGHRDYDPTTGRWLQRDPIGFAGGDTNLYAYVANDPVNLIDPFGLDYILFDGVLLTWVFEKNGKPTGKRMFPAYSGHKQVLPGVHARKLTEGNYWTSSAAEQLIGDKPHLKFDDWGPIRYRLTPDKATAARIAADGRTGGFFIHGGTSQGTLGCIEMADYSREQTAMQEFAMLMLNYKRQIQVRVKYPPAQYQRTSGSGY